MSALTIPSDFGKGGITPNALAALDPNWNPKAPSNFSASIRQGFGVISLRGKVWRINFGGESKPVMRADNPREPAGSLEVVMVSASPYLSKVYYADGYQEGADNPPDCWSNDAIRPDPSVENKVCDSCVTCPMNVFGSKTTENGKPAKACADSKRLAVVPLNDIDNEAFGGPMLLRIPAASLSELAGYDSKIRQMGYPLEAIGTRLSFDFNAAYPKVQYGPIRVLTEDEFRKVLELRDSAKVKDILMSGAATTPVNESESGMTFEQPPGAGAVQPQAQTGQGAAAQGRTRKAAKPADAPTAAASARAQAEAAVAETDRKQREEAEKAEAARVQAEAEAALKAADAEDGEGDEEDEEEALARQLAEARARKAEKAAAGKTKAKPAKSAEDEAMEAEIKARNADRKRREQEEKERAEAAARAAAAEEANAAEEGDEGGDGEQDLDNLLNGLI